MVDDVSINNDTNVVTLSISKIVDPIFEDTYRDKVCISVFIEVSVHTSN